MARSRQSSLGLRRARRTLRLASIATGAWLIHSLLRNLSQEILEFRSRPKKTARSPALRMSRMISAKGTPAEAQAAAETVRLKVLVPTLAVTKFRMFPSSIPIQEAIVQFNECVSRLPAGAERTYALHFTHLDINPSIHPVH